MPHHAPRLAPRLAAAALAITALATLAPSVARAAQDEIVHLDGTVDAAAVPALCAFVEESVDRVVLLNLSVEGGENDDGVLRFGDDACQISVPEHRGRDGNGHRVDGSYVPKFDTVRQGIIAFTLQAVDEGAVRLSGVPVVERRVEDLGGGND